MDLMNYNLAPNGEFLFGTDTMGRDIFSMTWYGGRISLFIGLLSTVISTAIAVVFGGISGIAPQWLDTLLMRLTEILLSVPNLLLVILLQAISREAERCDDFRCNRRDELDEHCKDCAYGGPADPQQRVRDRFPLYGRRIFSHPVATSGSEFCIIDHVHGRDECPQCDRF